MGEFIGSDEYLCGHCGKVHKAPEGCTGGHKQGSVAPFPVPADIPLTVGAVHKRRILHYLRNQMFEAGQAWCAGRLDHGAVCDLEAEMAKHDKRIKEVSITVYPIEIDGDITKVKMEATARTVDGDIEVTVDCTRDTREVLWHTSEDHVDRRPFYPVCKRSQRDRNATKCENYGWRTEWSVNTNGYESAARFRDELEKVRMDLKHMEAKHENFRLDMEDWMLHGNGSNDLAGILNKYGSNYEVEMFAREAEEMREANGEGV